MERWRLPWRDDITRLRMALGLVALIVAVFGLVLFGRLRGWWSQGPDVTPTPTPARTVVIVTPGPQLTPGPASPPGRPAPGPTVVIRGGGTTVVSPAPALTPGHSRQPSSPPAASPTPAATPTRCLVHNPLTGRCTPL